jgi:hypothetical protein
MSKHLLLASLLLVSCELKPWNNSSTKATGADSGAKTILEGTWQSGCMEISGGWRLKTTMTFKGSHASVEKIAHIDECQTPVSVERYESTFKINGEAEIKNIDFTLISAGFLAKTPAMAQVLNDAKMFEYTDWQSDVEKDLMGRKASPQSRAPEYDSRTPDIDIFKVEGDKLYFGDHGKEEEKVHSQPGHRPTVLKTDFLSKLR